MNSPKNICMTCRYFGSELIPEGECHANPPVIIEAFINKKTEHLENGERVSIATWWPPVVESDIACRLFMDKEGGRHE